MTNAPNAKPGPPKGRPPIGPVVAVRMPPELISRVEARALPGEDRAATVRRLLDAATRRPR